MFKINLFILFYFIIDFSFAQHPNILIGADNEPEEVSICINPKNPAIMVAGANINNYYFSSDTGKTWRGAKLESVYGVWGDPCILVDTNNVFYFFHLSNPLNSGTWIDRIVCQRSINNGINWSKGTYTGLNKNKIQDKHWAAIDRKTNNLYVCWSQFDRYESSDKKDSSNIMFSSSIDGGKTWNKSKRINEKSGDCSDNDNTVEGAVPAIGPNGEIYVAWAGNQEIRFDKSMDQGNTWMQKDVKVCDMPGGWFYKIPGLYRCNGLPVTACDISNSPYRGTIYINWTDQRNGSNNTDVWLIKSTDGGNTFSSMVRVNDDSTKRHQFLTWMTIDQTNGYLYFIFYDRRRFNDERTDVYMARSTDGGKTFTNFRISERSFIPTKSKFIGDYTNVTAHNNIVRPIWTSSDKFKRLSVWTAIINTKVIDRKKKKE